MASRFMLVMTVLSAVVAAVSVLWAVYSQSAAENLLSPCDKVGGLRSKLPIQRLLSNFPGLGLFLDPEMCICRTQAVTFVATALAWLTVVAISSAVSLHLSPRAFVGELRRRLPFSMHLTWGEFSSSNMNYALAASAVLESVVLCAPAFHPLVPLPQWTNKLVRLAYHVMFAHQLASSDRAKASRMAPVLLILFLCSWGPIMALRFLMARGWFARYRGRIVTSHVIQIGFHVFVVAAFLIMTLFMPILSSLMHPLAHEEVYSWPVLAWSLALAVVFQIIAPIISSHFRALDIRYKRTFIFIQFGLFSLEIVAWKAFVADAVSLLVVSVVIQASLLLLVWYSAPCAYSNVNQWKQAGFALPLWLSLCSLVQLARFGSREALTEESPASDQDNLYTLFVAGGSLAIFFGGACCAGENCCCRKEELQKFADVDPLAASYRRALIEAEEQLAACQLDFFSSGSFTVEQDRESSFHKIAALKLRYLQVLDFYRRSKEKILMPYYLGDDAAARLRGRKSPEGSTSSSSTSSDAQLAETSPRRRRGVDRELDDITSQLENIKMEDIIHGPHLGSGSYGAVYMGLLPSGKLIAVKELTLAQDCEVSDTLEQVQREVNVLRSLEHPNIIQYYGCRISPQSVYIFMEYATGGSLTSLVRKFAKLTEPVVQQYAQQILCGLEYLHSHNTIHRDIKGENILIDSHGIAKLADFGCSKALTGIASHSQAGCQSLVGSPFWMAPEVIKGGTYGTKADIWSVGCTVVEMLNGGQAPWAETFENVCAAMYFVGTTSGIPSNVPTDISQPCRDFLTCCFDRDVNKRATASQLLHHPWLDNILQSP